MLADILEVARVQGNRLKAPEIRKMFGDMELSEEQYEQIFAYLSAYHIKIEGYVDSVTEYTKAVLQEERTENPRNDNREEKHGRVRRKGPVQEKSRPLQKEEDSVYLKMYLEDLQVISDVTQAESVHLVDKISEGDSLAKNRFIEGNLRYVVEIADRYRNQGVTLEDLIQEGNIGLMNALENLPELTDKSKWKDFITGYVKQSVEASINERKESRDFENKILEKTKLINDAAKELAEDLGRKADIHELAECTKLSEKEIEDILNMYADSDSLVPDPGADHNSGHHHNHEG